LEQKGDEKDRIVEGAVDQPGVKGRAHALREDAWSPDDECRYRSPHPNRRYPQHPCR
jgi:hypothetical protein